MSLEYLNGLGRSKKSSGSGSGASKRQNRKAVNKASAKKYKGALKKIVKMAPTNPVQAQRMAKGLVKKYSPLNKMRVKKALKQQRQRQSFEEQGEPFIKEVENETEELQQIEAQAEEQEMEGELEVNEPEMENTEETQTEEGDEIGVFYPDEFGGFAGQRKTLKKEKAQSKTAKRGAKTEKTKNKGEATKLKAQARLDKARAGGGKFKDSFDKLLDTGGKFLDRKKGGAEDGDEKPKSNFFEDNKTLIIGGGLGLVALLFLPKLMKSKTT
jgi:hypothetical protein